METGESSRQGGHGAPHGESTNPQAILIQSTSAGQGQSGASYPRTATDQPRSMVKLTTRASERSRRTVSSREDEVWVKRLARMRSNEQPTLSISSTLPSLQTEVFRSITTRMQNRGISTSDLDQRYLNWCLPQFEDRDLWNRILEDPLLVSSAELDQVLDLRGVTQIFISPPTGYTSFYLRTFAFHAHELLHVLSELLNDGYGWHPKVYSWIEIASSLPDSFEIVYIRYAGMTSYEPWRRHLDDLVAEPKSFAIRFLQTALLNYPDIIHNAIVQEVGNARINVAIDQSVLDTREQALIALLDEGSLNTEPGGKFLHEPTTKDEEAFASLATEVTTLLPKLTKTSSSQISRRIEQLAENIQQYANANPVATGTAIYSFTKAVEETIVLGMSPSFLHNNFTPFVTMSSDVPLHVFRKPETFFLQSAVSSHLTQTIINYFGTWEGDSGILDAGYARRLAENQHLPFFDLYPWPKKSDDTLQDATRFTRQYLAIANPLVLIAHGDLVRSWLDLFLRLTD